MDRQFLLWTGSFSEQLVHVTDSIFFLTVNTADLETLVRLNTNVQYFCGKRVRCAPLPLSLNPPLASTSREEIYQVVYIALRGKD